LALIVVDDFFAILLQKLRAKVEMNFIFFGYNRAILKEGTIDELERR
jgi:hypothetical protein